MYNRKEKLMNNLYTSIKESKEKRRKLIKETVYVMYSNDDLTI